LFPCARGLAQKKLSNNEQNQVASTCAWIRAAEKALANGEVCSFRVRLGEHHDALLYRYRSWLVPHARWFAMGDCFPNTNSFPNTKGFVSSTAHVVSVCLTCFVSYVIQKFIMRVSWRGHGKTLFAGNLLVPHAFGLAQTERSPNHSRIGRSKCIWVSADPG